ncbi:MAG: hypothetical protein R3C69_04710 [Geminicoccaceae bacterium]
MAWRACSPCSGSSGRAAAGACPGADAPCQVADGEYYIRLPEAGGSASGRR